MTGLRNVMTGMPSIAYSISFVGSTPSVHGSSWLGTSPMWTFSSSLTISGKG
jgi:hypothetical protein